MKIFQLMLKEKNSKQKCEQNIARIVKFFFQLNAMQPAYIQFLANTLQLLGKVQYVQF